MKTCTYCGKQYPDDAAVCAIDGEPLVAASQKRVASVWSRFFGGGSEVPLDDQEKVWLEKSFQWLLDEFGVERFLKHAPVLPESSYFPDGYRGSEQDVVKLVARVCTYMDLDPNLIDVVFLFDRDETAAKHRTGTTEYSGAAGLYFNQTSQETRKKIAINVSEFKNPMRLVATIAHELGHVLLLGGGKLSAEDKGHEYVTDLITVFFGLGIFTANSAFQFSQWQDHSHQGWSASRSGYLSEEMFAYALACYTWMRGETDPQWSRHLSINVGHHFKRCLAYLKNGGQTSLRQLVPVK